MCHFSMKINKIFRQGSCLHEIQKRLAYVLLQENQKGIYRYCKQEDIFVGEITTLHGVRTQPAGKLRLRKDIIFNSLILEDI